MPSTNLKCSRWPGITPQGRTLWVCRPTSAGNRLPGGGPISPSAMSPGCEAKPSTKACRRPCPYTRCIWLLEAVPEEGNRYSPIRSWPSSDSLCEVFGFTHTTHAHQRKFPSTAPGAISPSACSPPPAASCLPDDFRFCERLPPADLGVLIDRVPGHFLRRPRPGILTARRCTNTPITGRVITRIGTPTSITTAAAKWPTSSLQRPVLV